MILKVEWINASRPPEFRRYIETTFRDNLLNIATPEQLAKAHKIYCGSPNKLFLDWPRWYYYARRDVVKLLSPKENDAKFKVTFE